MSAVRDIKITAREKVIRMVGAIITNEHIMASPFAPMVRMAVPGIRKQLRDLNEQTAHKIVEEIRKVIDA